LCDLPRAPAQIETPCSGSMMFEQAFPILDDDVAPTDDQLVADQVAIHAGSRCE